MGKAAARRFFSEDLHEQPRHQEADEPAAGEREHPGEHHFAHHAPVYRAEPPRRAHAHDGGGLGVRRAHRDAEHARDQQAARRRDVRREALVFFQLDHVHAHGFDDTVAADGGAKPHHDGAVGHQPDRDGELPARRVRAAAGEEHAQHEHAHELLPVLRAVHERHGRRAGDLRAVEKALRAPPVAPAKEQSHELDHRKSQHEPQHRGERQPVHDLDPLRAVDARKPVVERDRRAGEPRDERMALAGRDAEPPRRHRPEHDGKQRRAQRHERMIRMRVKIHHVGDRGRHARVEQRHDEHAQEVQRRRHEDGRLRPHRARGNARGDRVGRVRPAVDEDHARGQQHRQKKRQAAGQSRKEFLKGHRHGSYSRFFLPVPVRPRARFPSAPLQAAASVPRPRRLRRRRLLPRLAARAGRIGRAVCAVCAVCAACAGHSGHASYVVCAVCAGRIGRRLLPSPHDKCTRIRPPPQPCAPARVRRLSHFFALCFALFPGKPF